MFQSSPDPKAGCYSTSRRWPWRTPCFNPHPTRRPGATPPFHLVARVGVVSILTRPEGRVLPDCGPGAHPVTKVSILTRPEGRVLRSSEKGCCPECSFQSSPDPKAGCYNHDTKPTAEHTCFNPHPTRRPGATCLGHLPEAFTAVSILTRPEGRVLQPDLAQTDHSRSVSILTRPEGRVLPRA